MPIKSVKIRIRKKQKQKTILFFLMSQWLLNPKIRFPPRSKSVPFSPFTDTQTHTHRVTTKGTLSLFQDYFFFLQPVSKDRPNIRETLVVKVVLPFIIYVFPVWLWSILRFIGQVPFKWNNSESESRKMKIKRYPVRIWIVTLS